MLTTKWQTLSQLRTMLQLLHRTFYPPLLWQLPGVIRVNSPPATCAQAQSDSMMLPGAFRYIVINTAILDLERRLGPSGLLPGCYLRTAVPACGRDRWWIVITERRPIYSLRAVRSTLQSPAMSWPSVAITRAAAAAVSDVCRLTSTDDGRNATYASILTYTPKQATSLLLPFFTPNLTKATLCCILPNSKRRLQQIQNFLARAVVKARCLHSSQYPSAILSIRIDLSPTPSLYSLIIVVTVAWPPASFTLKITDRSFRHASPRPWKQLPDSFRQLCPHVSLPDSSLLHDHISSPASSSPLLPSIVPSLFHACLKTFLLSLVDLWKSDKWFIFGLHRVIS